MAWHGGRVLLGKDTDSDPPGGQSQSTTFLILSLCVVVGTALLTIAFLKIKKLYSNRRNSRRRTDPAAAAAAAEDGEDFLDEDQGPILDNPIWYIRTVGLQQSTIESITVFKFKKDDGLIEGTDCSVCLNEFQEDEALRLLPKCSHAFHISCIDTWLRSHKNCPLCRAPILRPAVNSHANAAEPNSNDATSTEVIGEENSEDNGGLGSHEGEEQVTAQVGVEEEMNSEILEKDFRHFRPTNCELRVVSDLGDHHPDVEDLQPVRRSISMDDSAALRIYLEVAKIPQVEPEGCSSNQLIQPKKANLQADVKRVNGSSSKYIAKSSSSIGRSLQKGSVAMKRSLSSSGKFPQPRRSSKSQDSILPL